MTDTESDPEVETEVSPTSESASNSGAMPKSESGSQPGTTVTMPTRTRLYNNDGSPMEADVSESLDYIDPGIVLLYADIGTSLVCSYFEGRAGHPIQGTVEARFGDKIGLRAVRTAPTVSDGDLTLTSASADDRNDRAWALEGLTEPPLTIGEVQTEAIRRLVSDSEPCRHGEGRLRHRLLGRPNPTSARVDLAVRDVYTGCRTFAWFVEAYQDEDVTIAVSKSGRIDCLAETDIVIHVDGKKVPPQSRVVPIQNTQPLIDSEKESLTRQRVRAQLANPVESLHETYRDLQETTDSNLDATLRNEFTERFGHGSDLRLVDRTREWQKRAGFLLLGLLVGLSTGFGLVVSVGSVTDFPGTDFWPPATVPISLTTEVLTVGAFAVYLLMMGAMILLKRQRARPTRR